MAGCARSTSSIIRFSVNIVKFVLILELASLRHQRQIVLTLTYS
jgi:hypothetical protein